MYDLYHEEIISSTQMEKSNVLLKGGGELNVNVIKDQEEVVKIFQVKGG